MSVYNLSERKTEYSVLDYMGAGNRGTQGVAVCSALVACISCLLGLGEKFKRERLKAALDSQPQ